MGGGGGERKGAESEVPVFLSQNWGSCLLSRDPTLELPARVMGRQEGAAPADSYRQGSFLSSRLPQAPGICLGSSSRDLDQQKETETLSSALTAPMVWYFWSCWGSDITVERWESSPGAE